MPTVTDSLATAGVGGLPSTTSAAKQDASDRFLKLLVTQMQNQDPLNPMDGQQMATQLAQFTTVEQLIAINASTTEQKATQEAIVKSLDALGKAQDAQKVEVAKLIEGQTAAGMVGKVGVFPGDQLIVGKDGEGTLMFDAKTLAGSGRVVVKDALGKVVSRADILVAAVGKEGMITADMVKPGAVVIDVAINRNAEGKLCGDVDFANVQHVASHITPVPGGVGPMTITMLLVNTIESAERSSAV